MTAPRRAPPRIVTVAGGKGGVGKSTIAANLAVAIGRAGHRVVLVDADLGAANLHTMFGALHPTSTIADFLDHRVDSLDGVTMTVAPTVELVPGVSRPGAANTNAAERRRLVRAIAHLACDCVVVDVGAGTSYTAVDLVLASDIKLFVLSPHLPSLHNAYALIKASVHRMIRKLAGDDIQRDLIDAALGNESKARTLPQLLAVIRPLDAVLADHIVDVLVRYGAGMVGNLVATDGEARALERMASLIYDHLLVHVPLLGVVRRTAALAGGLRAGAGTIADPRDAASPMFRTLACGVLDVDLARLRGEERVTQHSTMPLWVMRDCDDKPAGAP